MGDIYCDRCGWEDAEDPDPYEKEEADPCPSCGARLHVRTLCANCGELLVSTQDEWECDECNRVFCKVCMEKFGEPANKCKKCKGIGKLREDLKPALSPTDEQPKNEQINNMSDDLDRIIGKGGAPLLTLVCMAGVDRANMSPKDKVGEGLRVNQAVNEFYKLIESFGGAINEKEVDEAMMYIMLKGPSGPTR